MNPSPAAVAWVQAQNPSWSTQTDAQIAVTLNAATADNPLEQGQVAVVIDESALLAKLIDPSNGSLAKLLNWPNFDLLKADIDAGNVVGIEKWCAVLSATDPGTATSPFITQGEAAAIVAYVTSTVADPDWASTVPAPVAALGRSLDAADVAVARPQS
jgi:hypothetical protein